MSNKETKLLLEYTVLTVINNSLFKNGIIDAKIKETIEKKLRTDYILN